MPRFLFKNRSRLGFTLVELLIVVAIIGVLSTIGVPTFKKMIQKSKKSEAKANLGGLYTAEQAFFAEYGGYGNNLDKIGFQVDGTNFFYVTGFTQANCNGAAAVLPTVASNIGAAINDVYPGYFEFKQGSAKTKAEIDADNAGKAEADKVFNVRGSAAAGNPSISSGCLAVNKAGVLVNVASPEGESFLAAASGVIAPGVNKTAPAATETDQWTITSQRQLSNVQDGVR